MTNSSKSPESSTPLPTNSLAVVSLALGIGSFFGFGLLLGIPAIVTGLLSLNRTANDRSMSVAGIILGGISTFLSLLFIMIVMLFIAVGVTLPQNVQIDSTSDSNLEVESSRT